MQYNQEATVANYEHVTGQAATDNKLYTKATYFTNTHALMVVV